MFNKKVIDFHWQNAKELPQLFKELEKPDCIIEEISFERGFLNDEQAAYVLKNLVGKSVKSVDFSDCRLTAGSANGISNILENNKLKILYLNNNKIEDAGVAEIAKFLAKSHLEELYCYKIGLTNAGIQILAKAVAGNKTIKTLHIGGNGMTDESVPAILNLLKTNDVITELDLFGNDLSNKAVDVIEKIVGEIKRDGVTVNVGGVGEECDDHILCSSI